MDSATESRLQRFFNYGPSCSFFDVVKKWVALKSSDMSYKWWDC